MLSKKILFTLIALLGALFALVQSQNNDGSLIENWSYSGQMAVKSQPGMVVNGHEQALSNMYGSDSGFVQVPHFQGVLSPRFSNVDYGAHIKYNMPDKRNMGVPKHPLDYANMVDGRPVSHSRQHARESYAPSCAKGGMARNLSKARAPLPAGHSGSNYQQVYDALDGEEVSMGNELPVGSMSSLDGLGNNNQVVTFNNLTYTNKKSKLWGRGDMIRGDLAITPNQTGWFSVYPTINTDLNAGALNVMAGNNEGNAATLDLMYRASGGAQSTLAGVDVRSMRSSPQANMAQQNISSLSNSLGDLQVTAFP